MLLRLPSWPPSWSLLAQTEEPLNDCSQRNRQEQLWRRDGPQYSLGLFDIDARVFINIDPNRRERRAAVQ